MDVIAVVGETYSATGRVALDKTYVHLDGYLLRLNSSKSVCSLTKDTWSLFRVFGSKVERMIVTALMLAKILSYLVFRSF